ncbi:MAG: hypothetical protein EA412_00530, partial [Chitinophagaceae bacterium]
FLFLFNFIFLQQTQVLAQPGSSCSNPHYLDFYDPEHFYEVVSVDSNGFWYLFTANQDSQLITIENFTGTDYIDSLIVYKDSCQNLTVKHTYVLDILDVQDIDIRDLTMFEDYFIYLYYSGSQELEYILREQSGKSTVNCLRGYGIWFHELHFENEDSVELKTYKGNCNIDNSCDCCNFFCKYNIGEKMYLYPKYTGGLWVLTDTDFTIYYENNIIDQFNLLAGNQHELLINNYGDYMIDVTFHYSNDSSFNRLYCFTIEGLVFPDITPDNTNVCLGNPVTFSFPTPDPGWDIYTHRLNYGDGNSTLLNSGSSSYEYYYNSAGVYYPYLESHDPNNISCSTTIYLDSIVVEEPTADFDYSIQNCYSVQFENNSVCFTDFIWYFGDGNSSNDEEPLHTYDEPGTYDVILIGYNNNYLDWVIKPVLIEFPDAPILEEYSPILCDNEIFIEVLNFDSNFTYYFDNYNNITKASMDGNNVYIVGNDISSYASVELFVEDQNGCTNSILIEFQPQCILDINHIFCNALASEVISDLSLTNNTYASSQPILFNGVFTIDVDFTFQTAPNVLFGPDARIEVQSGSVLHVIRHSTLQSGCPYMWDGIKVQDGGSLYVETSTIKDAQEAIKSENGAYFNLHNSDFIDNFVNVRVMPYHLSHNHFMRNVNFYTDNGLLDPFYGENSAIGIEIIDNEDFVIEDNINHHIHFDNIDTAVHVINSNVDIYHITGVDLDYGIVASRETSGIRSISVLGDLQKNVQLEGRNTGIYVEGYANINIEDTEISDFDNGIWLYNGFWIGTVNIDGNQIVRCQTTGILLHELKQLTIFVNENDIDVQYSFNLGKGIVFNGLPEFNLDSEPQQGLPHILQITENDINNYRIGIEKINNGSLSTTIGGNEIIMTKNDYLGVFYAKTTGIRVGNSVGNTYVICNQCKG